MDHKPQILDDTKDLSPQERAAAIAHWVYVKTTHGTTGWETRVADAWNDLDQSARDFNLRSIETWADEEGVLESWVESVKAYRAQRR